ncbi:unnamed protein product [Rotaria sp. Silwood1]|nr:unnamed protein product [Rotaria sp. Silwood1]
MSITNVCIITGSSSGLGLLTAKKLVAKDFYVIFACRDEVKTMLLLQKLKEESGRSNFEFMKLDLGSFDSIRRTEDFGSECEVFAATSDTLNGKTGVFMSDMKEARSSEESYDVEKAKRLWDLSEQLTHQNI